MFTRSGVDNYFLDDFVENLLKLIVYENFQLPKRRDFILILNSFFFLIQIYKSYDLKTFYLSLVPGIICCFLSSFLANY